MKHTDEMTRHERQNEVHKWVIELRRVLSKPLKHFTERNQLKNAAGFKAD